MNVLFPAVALITVLVHRAGSTQVHRKYAPNCLYRIPPNLIKQLTEETHKLTNLFKPDGARRERVLPTFCTFCTKAKKPIGIWEVDSMLELYAELVLPRMEGDLLPRMGGDLLPRMGGDLLSRVGGDLLPRMGGDLLPRVGGDLLPREMSSLFMEMFNRLRREVQRCQRENLVTPALNNRRRIQKMKRKLVKVMRRKEMGVRKAVGEFPQILHWISELQVLNHTERE